MFVNFDGWDRCLVLFFEVLFFVNIIMVINEGICEWFVFGYDVF